MGIQNDSINLGLLYNFSGSNPRYVYAKLIPHWFLRYGRASISQCMAYGIS